MKHSLNRWNGITESEWVTYYADNDQARLSFLLARIEEKSRILEAGCGCGFQAGIVMKERTPEVYLGFDTNPEKVASCAEMAHVNIEQTYFSMRHFYKDSLNVGIESEYYANRFGINTILCTEVLEHVPDWRHAVDRLCGILPEGSQILVTVPAENKLLDVPGHINNFNPVDLREEFEKHVKVSCVAIINDTYSFIEAHK